MKKNLFTFLLLALCLTGCQNGEKPSTSNTTELPTSSSSTIEQKNATIISPKGTPAIAIANYAINHQDDVELVAGPDALVAAFTGGTKDIIVAPINLETYPQSGIFVKNDSLNQIKDTLTAIDEQYNTINEDVENTAKNAAQLLDMKEALLKKAIPNCGYKVVEDEFTYVKGYYQAMIDLGLDKAVGGKLPDEDFYITK